MIMAVIGIFLIFSESFFYVFKELNSWMDIHAVVNRSNKFEKHLRNIASAIAAEGKENAFVLRFKCITAIVGVISVVLTFKYLGVFTGLFLSVILTCLPYLVVRLKLSVVRRTGSFDGEFLVKELKNQYKANYTNMLLAIDETIAAFGEDYPFAKRTLFKLSLKIKTYQTEEELEDALETFVFTFDTSWSRILSNNIYAAVYEGVNVTLGLEDLADYCSNIKVLIEKQKQGQLQNTIMAKYLAPVLAVFFYALGASLFSFSQIFKMQFTSSGGILCFSLIVIFIFANITIVTLGNKPKYDI